MRNLYLFIVFTMILCSCNAQSKKITASTDKPWNMSIYLDLSDRLTTGKGEAQMLRDTAIISYIIDQFVNNVVRHKIVPCDDKFQIFFYPTDGISNASALSKSLTINLKDYTKQPAQKKQILLTMKADMMSNLVPIYEETLQNQRWLGSDIWGFFKKRIKTSCVDENYRNILIILTDGYIYHKDSRQQQGNQYSYILSQNIMNKNMQLIPCQTGLDNLEVLFLEINPTQQAHYDRMNDIIGTWLSGMGVEHYQIEETDVTANITPAIKQFLK